MSEIIDFFFDRIPPLLVFETSENLVSWAGQRYLRDTVTFSYGKLRFQLWQTDAVAGALETSGLSGFVKSQVRQCLSLEDVLVSNWHRAACGAVESDLIDYEAIAEILDSVGVWGVVVRTNSGPIKMLDLDSVDVVAQVSEFFRSDERHDYEGAGYFSQKHSARN